jgi:hypothetical protein
MVALGYLLLWFAPPGPAALVVAYAGYEENLAIEANPQGHEWARRMGQLASRSQPWASWYNRGGELRLVGNPQLRRGVDWARGLDRAGERVVIVCFALHGGADERGGFLYPHDASADPADRLYLDTIWNRLAELPQRTQKLVLFDATGNGPNITAGQPANRFAQALAEARPAIEAIPNLVVLSASGPDERSWPSANGRTSLFGKHVHLLLASGERLTAASFAQKLQAAVGHDAARLYEARQTVTLLPDERRAAGIPLMFQSPAPPAEEEGASVLPAIQAAWKPYHAANAAAARAASPGAWRLWQAWLRRYEVLALAGAPQADQALAQAEAAGALVRSRVNPGLVSPPDTLAGPALVGAYQTPPQPFPALEELWAAQPTEGAKVWQRLQETTPRALLQQALVERAAENPARNLARAADLLRLIDDPFRPARPTETHVAVLLARDLPNGFDEDLTRATLRLRLEAEQTAFGNAPGYAYAERVIARSTIEQADVQRRLAEDLLLATDVGNLVTCRTHLQEAQRGYAEARIQAEARRLALAALHRALDELPAHLHWMPAENQALFAQVRNLEKALVQELAPAELAKQAAALQAALDALRDALTRFAQHCTLAQDHQALAAPMLQPSLRWQLIERRERLARKERTLTQVGELAEPDREEAARLQTLARAWADGDDYDSRLRKLSEQIDTIEKKDLPEAERLARRLDAGQWQVRDRDPADQARRQALADLLVWQAERAWADAYYREDNSKYDAILIRDYLRDAALLNPTRDLDPLRKRLEAPRPLGIQTPAETRLLAGETRPVSATLRTPVGIPMLWAEAGAGLRLPATVGRIAQFGDGPAAEVRIASPDLDRDEQTPPDDTTPRKTALIWHGRFRGLKLENPATVWLHPVAESTRVDGLPAEGGAVAVRAPAEVLARYGSANGAVAIVLDCSGSTGPPAGEAMTEATRYRKLLRSLRKVLAAVPRGTTLSLWVFGEDTGRKDSPEATIRRAVEPVRWSGSEEQLTEVMRSVESLRPWNESPIVRTMLRAKGDLIRAEGARTLIVLTDGMDNRIAADKEFNPDKLPVPELLLAAFKGTRINVQVVGFEVVEKEEAAAREQFAALGKLTPPGGFTTVRKIDDVARAVERSLKPDLRYQLLGPNAYRSEAVGIAAQGESNRWLVPPAEGDYRLRTLGVPLDQSVSLGRGRALLLELAGDGERPTAYRVLYGRDGDNRLAPARQGRDWRAAVLQNQWTRGRLGLFACLEKLPSPEEVPLQQPAPKAVWLRLDSGTSPVRWSEAFGYPAPCFSIDAVGWPALQRPRLRLWWSPELEPRAVVLRRAADFRTLDELPRRVRLGDVEVRMDSAAVERRWIDGQQRWCLVMRVSHPPGEPVQIALEGMPTLGGAEHRWHTSAHRTAALFWFAGLDTRERVEDTIDRRLSGVRLISLGALQREAELRKYQVDFADLDAPAATPERPRPVFTPGGM